MAHDHPLRPWLEQQAERIERLCEARHLWVQCQGGIVTPRLVRFHLLVSPSIPLKRLLALEEELALVLEVPKVRICRDGGVVAVEVPRPQPVNVALLRLQASLDPLPPFTALLGQDSTGAPLLLRLSAPEVAHLLIAGTTGSGKTALARAILSSLALANDPDELRFLLVDPKGHGFSPFLGLPHLAGPILRGGPELSQRLEGLVEEMVWREETGIRTPRVLLAVDEVADLLATEPALGELLTRIAARGRSAGLHLMLCTQKPTAEALGSLLRANLPCRLVGRVVSAQEAVLASGIRGTGAEQLLGRGDFVLVAGGELIRFQAAYIGADEIRAMVSMLQEEQLAFRGREARPSAPAQGGRLLPGQWVARLLRAVRGTQPSTGNADRAAVSGRWG